MPTKSREFQPISPQVFPYTISDRQKWNEFVISSKNGTFMLRRDFMEYHSERFQDFSLLITDRAGNVLALLPANRDGNHVISHAGLTYAGIVSDGKMTTPIMLQIFDAVLDYLQRENIQTFTYKSIPHIYHKLPAEEDTYALFLCNARLLRRDVSSAIFCSQRARTRKASVHDSRRAERAGLTVRETDEFELFWDLLQSNLKQRHGKVPVHSIEEIRLLQGRFPNNIKLFGCYRGQELLAGTLIYEDVQVAHTQYIASSEKGRSLGATHLLIESLLSNQYRSKHYWDFGHSNESAGRLLNQGLVEFKEAHGARAVVYDQYEIDLTSCSPGQCGAALFRRDSKNQ